MDNAPRYTLADVRNLKEAIATGARKMRFADGREVEYRTLSEMERTLARAEREATGTATPLRVVGGYRSGLS